MIQLKTENLTKIAAEHGLSADEMSSLNESLPKWLEAIQAKDQGFYSVIDDQSVPDSIEKYASDNKDKFDHFVVLAIGGSSLGTICLQQSLTHLFKPGKLTVLDNIDPVLLREVENTINLEKTLFIVVTKSGTTPETVAEYLYFRKRCEDSDLTAKDHFVFITDPEKGFLRKVANEEGIESFAIPPNVGGRFSVLTPVGLLPAALIDLNIKELIRGAQEMRDSFLSKDPSANMPFQLAAIQYLLAKKGKIINVMIPYAQKMIRFADWYRQLLAESIGKKLDNDGKEVFVGITPINALGATDQHSQSQLYNEGPNDKLHIFAQVQNLGENLEIPSSEDESLSYLQGVSFNELIHTEMEGTVQAFTKNDRPNITIEIDEINERALGGLFLLFEGATAFLGEMFNINAFDQPGVELSKQITRELLTKS